MKDQDKTAVRQRFNRHAASYDEFARVQQTMAYTLLQFIENRGYPPLKVLEIGCGTGTLTRILLAAFPGCTVTALDLAPDMVAAAEKRTSHYADRCFFTVADIEEWASRKEGEMFDLIISNACFQWLADPEHTLRHLRRLLRRGGSLAFATFGSQTFHELHAAFRDAYMLLEKPFRRHGLSLQTAEEWITLLTNTHFLDIHAHREEVTELHASVSDFLHSVKAVGAGSSEAERSSGLGQRCLFTKMSQCYVEKFGVPQGVPATYELLFYHCTVS